ncbi:VOC family protein [Sporosarcina sp. FSL K6-6792]|uniref:VOC family protein n=1 Tax=Sporosarcina sp. FSL K6-6792 TaxID=2921559 RepID=UPI004046949F
MKCHEFLHSRFEESEILNVVHQENGMIMHATFTIKGQAFMCIDSSINQEFTFTPSTSLSVTSLVGRR